MNIESKYCFIGGFLTLILLSFTSCAIKDKAIGPIATKSKPAIKALYLTIDLCPSSKPLNKPLFIELENLGQQIGKPVPVAICVSGKWILRHEKELPYLTKSYLNITWVNHSYNHPIGADFLDDPKINFKQEVIRNVALMQKHHLVISPYFRFPGLIYNQHRLAELKQLGYKNLPADAWLAKGEQIKNSSIVLVHGNGNEPLGVKLLLNYLSAHKKEIIEKKLQFKPLPSRGEPSH